MTKSKLVIIDGGVPPQKDEVAISPHAPVDPLDTCSRNAARNGGVSDAKGNPTDEQKRASRAAKRRVKKRPPPVMIAKTDNGRQVGPTSDAHGSHMRLLDTFGTRSDFFLARQMHEIENMATHQGEEDERTATAVNSAIAMVAAVAPTNEIEAALAVQMAGTHALSCEMAARVMRNTDIDRMNIYVNAASKLQRTFLAQLEALDRLRGKGQQTVRVEHVTVEAGAQAIVGDVHHHPILPKPKDPARVATTRPRRSKALPGPNPVEQPLPGPGHAERQMQDAWRPEHGGADRQPERAEARVFHAGSDR